MHSFFKFILYPFSFLYRLITSARNFFYDKRVFKSTQFSIPVIGVGNLTVGGTGKTPMVEYLLQLLKPKKKLAVLSRGYGRSTRGFRIAGDEDNAKTIGDEPLQIYTKYKEEVIISVGEERILAVPQLLYNHPEIEVIILDDAFQHRAIRPSLQILLTEYYNPFYSDTLLPSGRLRESKNGAKRADVIIVTKCPEKIEKSEMEQMKKNIIKAGGPKEIFFTTVIYGEPYLIDKENGDARATKESQDVVLVSAIANAKPLAKELNKSYNVKKHFSYPDHHTFSRMDILKINRIIQQEYSQAILMTTEKDAVKLREFTNLISCPVYVMPMYTSFLRDEDKFESIIREAAVYKEI